ncbi:MAG: TrmO family methyltransferase domain-containing protein [Planctomycetota bacterium]
MSSNHPPPRAHLVPRGRAGGGMRAIGRIRTPFGRGDALPAPGRAGAARGVVLVRRRFAPGLKDIEGFDRLWLMYRVPSAGSVPLLVSPDGSGEAHGVFATRVRRRPGRIAFSCVKLFRRRGSRLWVEGVDMLNNARLLDIQPYVPDLDAFKTSWAGWMEHVPARVGRHPLRAATWRVS